MVATTAGAALKLPSPRFNAACPYRKPIRNNIGDFATFEVTVTAPLHPDVTVTRLVLAKDSVHLPIVMQLQIFCTVGLLS
jgi:hypothetical protein